MGINSISTRATILLLSISVLVILIIGVLWLYSMYAALKNDISISNLQDARLIAGYVSFFTSNIVQGEEVAAASPYTIEAIKTNDSERLRLIGQSLDSAIANSDIIILLDRESRVIYHSKGTNTSRFVTTGQFDAAVNANGPYITSLYYSDSLNDYIFSLAVPVRDNGTIVGYIVTSVRPETLDQLIQEQKVKSAWNILVIDNQGLVVSHDNKTYVEKKTNISYALPVRDLLRGEEGVIETSQTFDGQPRIVGFSPVPGIGWGVVASTHMDTIYAQLIHQIWMILLVLAAVSIAILILSYLVSRYLTDPIVDLSRTMKKVSTGNYRERAKAYRDDEIGELSRTFNTMMDDLERTKGELADAKARAEFYVDLMGHDINNMNHIALGYLEMALDTLPLTGEGRKLIEKPVDTIENSSRLIENVRKLQEAKVVGIRPEIIDLYGVLETVKTDYSGTSGRNVTITLHSSSPCNVMANNLVKDIFSNLVGNAIKHSDHDQPLTIILRTEPATEDQTAYIKTTVEDNGPGIPDDQKNSLFRKFQRGQTKASGKGLGLFLVKTLVDSYGGKVWIEDRVPGDYAQGTSFVVLLPAA